MELRFKGRRFTCSMYTANISYRGLVAVWPGQHAGWRQGFVLRVLWFGFVVRWNRRMPGDFDDHFLKTL
jgi:hypothetical protein